MDSNNLRIAIDCDDAAIELKKVIVEHIESNDLCVEDLDYLSDYSSATYPEIGYNLALKIKEGIYERGILLCGTGLGMAIIANKVQGVYAGVCHDVYSAERLRKSNNAQILTMGARVIGPELAKVIINAWLRSEFQGGRSLAKFEKIRELEKRLFGSVC
jgi:ribose 5-phosphate isomerase B